MDNTFEKYIVHRTNKQIRSNGVKQQEKFPKKELKGTQSTND